MGKWYSTHVDYERDRKEYKKPEHFRVIIAGSRTFKNYDLLEKKCDIIFSNKKPTSIICGEAAGADTLGKQYAEKHGIPVESFPADWEHNGRDAGYMRNIMMADYADALVAFWNGRSRGTQHMIDQMRTRELPIRIIFFN